MDKAEQDKQSAIIKAQGEATSARLIGEAIQQNPAFITLRKIEAARDIAGTISGAANKVFLSSDSLLLNLVSAWHLQSCSHEHMLRFLLSSFVFHSADATSSGLQGDMDVLGQPRVKQPR